MGLFKDVCTQVFDPLKHLEFSRHFSDISISYFFQNLSFMHSFETATCVSCVKHYFKKFLLHCFLNGKQDLFSCSWLTKNHDGAETAVENKVLVL